GPLALPHEVVPLGDEVPQRAAVVAEGDAAVHAAPRLAVEHGRRLVLGAVLVHLFPVEEAHGHGTARDLLAVADLEESAGVSHGPPPGSTPTRRAPSGRGPRARRSPARRPSARTRPGRRR